MFCATNIASSNTGGFFPTSVKCKSRFSLKNRCMMERVLSPTHTTMVLLRSWVANKVARMLRATLEWMPPHKPRSDVTAIIKCLGFLSSSITSALSYRAMEQRNNYQHCCIIRSVCIQTLALTSYLVPPLHTPLQVSTVSLPSDTWQPRPSSWTWWSSQCSWQTWYELTLKAYNNI